MRAACWAHVRRKIFDVHAATGAALAAEALARIGARAAGIPDQASTTARYSRGAVGKSRKVATLRITHRGMKNEA